MFSLTRVGIDQARRKGQFIITNVERITSDTLHRFAGELVNEIMEIIMTENVRLKDGRSKPGHIVTGEMLKTTGVLEEKQNESVIGSTAPHAGFHEFGTSKFEGHPIFQDVIFSKTNKFRDVVVKEYRETFG